MSKSTSVLLFLICNFISMICSTSLEHLRSLTPIEVANIVKEEFHASYLAYQEYAWGCDELNPLSYKNKDEACHNYNTISTMWTPIDALDTMYLMGLDDLIDDTLQLLCHTPFNNEPKFTFAVDQNAYTFDYFLRLLGGLLSSYNFIEDKCLYNLALELSDLLYPIFTEITPSQSGLPWRYINLKTGIVDTTHTDTSPAEAGTNILEYGIMSVLTGDMKYYNTAMNVIRILYESQDEETGLIGNHIYMDRPLNNDNKLSFIETKTGIGSQIDSYYEYIIKCWALFNNTECRDMWLNINASVIEHLSYYNNDLLWFKQININNNLYRKKDNYDYDLYAAFYSGVLSLSSVLNKSDENNKYNLELAKLNQEANWYMWNKNNIEPYVYNSKYDKDSVNSYNLNPENFESNYYLYMITNDSLYYDRALIYLYDLMKYCKCGCDDECVGYTGLENVRTKKRSNALPSYWFAESLKYLYLTFMRNEANNPLPFDEYIFSTEAHPFPKSLGNKLKNLL